MELDQNRLMLYVLGWLAEEEMTQITAVLEQQPQWQVATVQLQQFIHRLQRSQIQKQAQAWLQMDETLDQITAWAQGELAAEAAAKVEAVLGRNGRYQTFATNLKELLTHLEAVDRPQPAHIFENLLQGLRKRPQPAPPPTLRPAWGLRGAGETPMLLAIPPEYGFQVHLFIGGVERERLVWGKLTARNLMGANTWLLPASGGIWHQAQVDDTGSFSFATQVSPGNYHFEMAWGDEFLELSDVVIPAA
jgi:hypothetical protein